MKFNDSQSVIKRIPMVSVIVPVYNSEDDIEKCVDSILKQSWNNLEIILIDDGSTDRSSYICDKLCEKDTRIKVIHQINKGVSCARNIGLTNAQGEYIVFVDADDELTKDSIRIRMLKIAYSDLVVTGYDVVDSYYKKLYTVNRYEEEKLTQTEMLTLMFGEHQCGYQGYLWNKLFKMELIRTGNLKFREGVYYNEDRLFLIEYLMKSKCVSFERVSTYLYKINPKGAMESAKVFSRKVYNKWITEFFAYRIMSKELREYDSTLCSLCSMDAMRSAINHKKMIPKEYREERKYFSDCIREFSRDCISCRNISLNKRLTILGHYVLGR